MLGALNIILYIYFQSTSGRTDDTSVKLTGDIVLNSKLEEIREKLFVTIAEKNKIEGLGV